MAFAPGSIGDNDSLALVKASGAKGAGIGFGSSQIGDSGYGIFPYMSAYRENRVYLDISTLENDVEIKNTSEVKVPRSGAVVLVNFETDEGRSIILELQRTDKGFIPLGADVLNEKMNLSVPSVRPDRPISVASMIGVYCMWSGEIIKTVNVTSAIRFYQMLKSRTYNGTS